MVLFIGNILLSSNISQYQSNSFTGFSNPVEKLQPSGISSIYQQKSNTFNPNTKVRKIIKNANINLKTSNYDKSYKLKTL